MKSEKIEVNLKNIIRAIDSIGNSNLRRYIDSQVVIIHRKIQGLEVKNIESEAKEYWIKSQYDE